MSSENKLIQDLISLSLTILGQEFNLSNDIDLGTLTRNLEYRYKKIVTLPNFQTLYNEILALPEENYTCDFLKREVSVTGTNFPNIDSLLTNLKPWRKGPFQLGPTLIDAEWDSYLKWTRIESCLPCMENKKVLDIGCNSGYYLFKMIPHKPRFALGIDPSSLYFLQFSLLNHLAKADNLHYLPLGQEDMACFKPRFDFVFSMGILSHRRSPLDALSQTRDLIRSKGHLVMETLMIEGEGDFCLSPKGSYAAMTNVYFVPTRSTLISWLERSGFENIQVLDVSKTTGQEQRQTTWSGPVSLETFLNPNDPTKTKEGYPAPVRVMILAQRKFFK